MNRSLLKAAARLVLASFLWQALAGPTASLLALTGGPTQPEFSSFEPVTTTNMVNPLTGQFTYNLPVINIPGPNGSGYAMSLSYHSGVSPEEEASWVGYGWTLNPGAITRAKRGFPDEYDGEEIRYWNQVEPNTTVTGSLGASWEILSQEPDGSSPPIPNLQTFDPDYSASVSVRYNSHKGYGFVAGVRSHAKGMASLEFSVSDEGASFSADLSAGQLLNFIHERTGRRDSAGNLYASTWHRLGLEALNVYQRHGYPYLQYSVAGAGQSPHYHPYKGESTNIQLSVLGPLGFLPAGVKAVLKGNYTEQKNDPAIDRRSAYGYMHSAKAGDEDMMDYYVEKPAPFNKRDAFMSIPFSNADYFNISGEGIGGGFRLWNKRPGQFHPNKISSSTTMFNAEADIHVGTNLGLGVSIGAGKSWFDVNPWKAEVIYGDPNTLTFASEEETDEPYFFRMNNDLGGYVTYASNDDAFRPVSGNVPAVHEYDALKMNAFGVQPELITRQRSGRSSYIAYSTVGEMKSVRRSGIYRPDLLLLEDHGFSAYHYLNQLPSSAVGEMSITNPSGAKYVYGLPVIALQEEQFQYGLKGLNYTVDAADNLVNVALPPRENLPTVVGQQSLTPYVSEYLLTSITSPDYIDRTHDGYTNDDFGGWVRFSYWPSTLHWNDYTGYYKWRVPYNGLSYNRNYLSDKKDDVGTVSSGKKGMFYLSAVETKSHIALFYANGLSAHPKKSVTASYGSIQAADWLTWWSSGNSEDNIRKDGYPAAENETEASNGGDATTVGEGENAEQAPNPMRKLEKIELWSKDENGNPKEKLQTVHFEYDYSLCRGLPNSFEGAGKLTLRRVFFEYNGVVNARISPYVFGYEYKKSTDYNRLPSDIKDEYDGNEDPAEPSIIGYADDLTDGENSEQNPDYQNYHVGRWGYYRYAGPDAVRAKNLVPWDDQNPPTDAFDPAAWNLKWIRLPSGGEIHVQYEQNDYGYVQDQPAMVMAQLDGYTGYEPSDGDDRDFVLDMEATFGIAPENAAEHHRFVEAMHELFVDKGEKMFFKALHSLDGEAANPQNKNIVELDLKRERLEYITGYVKVKDVWYDETEEKIHIRIDDGDYATPDALVNDFIAKHRGKLNAGRPLDVSAGVEGSVRGVVDIIPTLVGFLLPGVGEDDDEIDYDRSWVRIPISASNNVVRPKLGGGIRVKRLLMYDPGRMYSESGVGSTGREGHLFGTEYLYVTEQGYTSGVAANEPTEGREENALVKVLDKRQDQGSIHKLIAGKDREQFEGPMGESLLPAPAVVYSRVVAKNIYSGKTSPGFTIHEYYTAKDYPSQCIYDKDDLDSRRVTDVDDTSDPPLPIWTPYVSIFVAEQRATQGYSFILNSMHGQIKKVATYGGRYEDDPKDWVESSMQEYEYFTPGEKIPVLKDYPASPEFEYLDLGKEMEVTFEGRELNDVVIDAMGKIDASLTLTFIPVVLWFTGSGHLAYTNHHLKTFVSCKVVRYPVVVRKVTSRQDGIESVVQNMAFNPLTGAPLVTQTTDGYAGLDLEKANGTGSGPHDRVYKSFSWPAALIYGEMGQKASNEGKVLQSDDDITISKMYGNGMHYLTINYNTEFALCDAERFLSTGDLIRVWTTLSGGSTTFDMRLGDYHVERIIGNRVILQPYSMSPVYRFDPVIENYTGAVSFKVIKSGKTNQLNAPRAGIATYGPAAGQ